MRFYPIANGSSGNCYYIGTEGKKYLVDAGISFRRISQALAAIETDISEISGIFITHEHSDHISGIPMIAKKTKMDIFSSPGTLREIRKKYEEIPLSRFHDLSADCYQDIEGLKICPFSVFHDAAEPLGYVFENIKAGKKIGIVTDTGKTEDNIMEAIRDVNLLVLEANYDEHTLKNGDYPALLKRRILSSEGHLSNLAAARVLYDISAEGLSLVFLGHLSKENNLPYLAKDTVCKFLEDFSREMTFELECLSRSMPGKIVNL